MKLSGWSLREPEAALHYAPSALPVSVLRAPGALPQAVTFRAFGAGELHEGPNKALFYQTEFRFWFGRFDAWVDLS